MAEAADIHVPPEAADIVGYSFKWIRRFVVAWLLTVFLLLASVTGTVLYKLNQVDSTVTSHNTELAQTLKTICTIIVHFEIQPIPAGCLGKHK